VQAKGQFAKRWQLQHHGRGRACVDALEQFHNTRRLGGPLDGLQGIFLKAEPHAARPKGAAER
jgi:hypothetical protein